MKSSVTVVIPAFNRAATIRRAINSVRLQQLGAEIIVVDDCSTDGTSDMVRGAQLVRHSERLGASAARNSGLEQATTAIIAFLDSDDEWLSGYLAAQLKSLEHAHASVTGFVAVSKNGRPRRVIPTSMDVEGSTAIFKNRHGGLTTSCIAVRREVMEAGIRFDEELPSLQDLDFVAQAAEVGGIAINREVLVRKHSGTHGRVYSGRNIFLGRKLFVDKWATQIRAAEALDRQLRLLLLSAQNAGNDTDVIEATERLRCQNDEDFSVLSSAALASTMLGRGASQRVSRLLNIVENASVDVVKTRLADIAAWR
jgi:glycosyltransferase involved in cell wall biosynthesis